MVIEKILLLSMPLSILLLDSVLYRFLPVNSLFGRSRLYRFSLLTTSVLLNLCVITLNKMYATLSEPLERSLQLLVMINSVITKHMVVKHAKINKTQTKHCSLDLDPSVKIKRQI